MTITATTGAIIYYTTDDTVPTKESKKYDTPITLTETTTIRAIAIEDGHIMSDVVGMAFTKESSGGSSSDSGSSSGGSSSDGGTSVEAVPAAARTVAAAPTAVHQAVPPTADLKLLRHRTITRTRLRLRPKPEKMVQL